MMSTASAPSIRRPTAQPSAAWAPPQHVEPGPDLSWVVALSVVVLVALGAIALLMNVAHRPDGWPVMRMVLPGNAPLILAGQCGLALAAGVVGTSYGRRAMRHWAGDLGGGRVAALVNAAIAGGLFFAAIELVRGGW
jgi:hypothetical protein